MSTPARGALEFPTEEGVFNDDAYNSLRNVGLGNTSKRENHLVKFEMKRDARAKRIKESNTTRSLEYAKSESVPISTRCATASALDLVLGNGERRYNPISRLLPMK